MAALNPITHPNPEILADVLAIDPALKAEERLQSLLYLWLRFYFTGTPFNTLKPDGSTEAKTFTQCGFAFQEAALAESPSLPQIHLVMPIRDTSRRDYLPGEGGHDDDWTIDMVVKVPNGLSGTEMTGTSAQDIARDVGGQLEWLLCSPEREALVEQGISRVRLSRPSTILPAATWQMRMLVFSCRTRREQARKRFS